MEIKIKNMVCNRCIMVVKQIFERAGINVKSISLGIVETESELTNMQINNVSQELTDIGFEVITEPAQLVEQIKAITWEFLKESGDKEKFVSYLSTKIKMSHHHLHKLFSTLADISLEKYFIQMKIERIKELLVCENQSLSEIAVLLNYSSVSYLCRQFKEVTGHTPSHFLNAESLTEK